MSDLNRSAAGPQDDATGKLIASNDNWKSDELNILISLIPPSSERESAIVMTLGPQSDEKRKLFCGSGVPKTI